MAKIEMSDNWTSTANTFKVSGKVTLPKQKTTKPKAKKTGTKKGGK